MENFRESMGRTASLLFYCGATALAAVAALPAWAAQTEEVRTIAVEPAESEEQLPEAPLELDAVTVTAEKRGPAPVQSVPLSVSVVDADTINDFGLHSLGDALAFVPNVKIEDAGYYVSPRIRGLSVRPENVGFEPPAAVAVDGITYGRLEFFGTSMFDVDRVEVLRGPQGTAFGKNTTAGMIHVVTKPAGDEFNGHARTLFGGYDFRRTEVSAGGPLLQDFARFRVAGFNLDRDGYVENTTAAVSSNAAPELQGRDDSGYRVKVELPDVLGAGIRAGYERVKQGSLGTAVETVSTTDAVTDVFRRYDPNADVIAGNHVTSLDFADFRRSTIESYGSTIDLPIAGWNVTAIGGHADVHTDEALDVDFTPVPATLAEGGIKSIPTTTYELRLSSPDLQGFLGAHSILGIGLGSSDVLLGVFQQDSDIDGSRIHFTLPHTPFLELAAATRAGSTPGSPVVGGFFGFTPPPGAIADGGSDELTQNYDQHGHTEAVYGQVRWRFLPMWMLNLGGRYSTESKDAHWRLTFDSPDPNALVTAAGFQEFDEARAREDSGFHPRAALSFAPWDELSLHAHWAQSFKSGGFNAFAYRPVENQLQYGREQTTDYGFDIKTALLARSLQVNASFYRLDLEDFQVLTKVPQAGVVGLGVSQVANAPAARTEGLELDGTWLAADWLRFQLAYALNRSIYRDFTFNSCAGDAPSPPPGQDGRCDSTGRPFPYAPKHSGTFGIGLAPPGLSFWGITPFGFVAAEYASKQYLDTDLDERQVQGSYVRYRANIGLSRPDQRWSISVACSNCTDETTYFRMADVNAGIFSGIQDPPRQITTELRLAW